MKTYSYDDLYFSIGIFSNRYKKKEIQQPTQFSATPAGGLKDRTTKEALDMSPVLQHITSSTSPSHGEMEPTPVRLPAAIEEPSLPRPVDSLDVSMAAVKNKKRPVTDSPQEPRKATKRRAARACVSCRARKVRCDVIEGAPCGNCRWDKVECIVQESLRRKKNPVAANLAGRGRSTEARLQCRAVAPSENTSDTDHGHHNSLNGNHEIDGNGHIPVAAYQQSDLSNHDCRRSSPWNTDAIPNQPGFGGAIPSYPPFSSLDESAKFPGLPPFLRPMPDRIAPEDVAYLEAKGALSIPGAALQSALLRAYIEYVHPYMPLLDLHPLLAVIDRYDGSRGSISLFLYHCVMFSAAAFVDMRHLRDAGYATRKAARRAYFRKTRLLYDFDYEPDRLVLVQGLMLMTYWYETPDDQKDTWHWMGVAVSLAHTIGLHRNPEMTNMAPATQKLWKRIWWSCFMRDRLIALGMRRPTRIKDEDFDVPMLVEADFEIKVLPDDITILPPECTLMRDVEMQRELAVMCVQKAKLCVCISDMLKTQYAVLIREHVKPDHTTNSTMMLFPNKKPDNMDSVKAVDAELRAWEEALPACCRYRALQPGDDKNGRSTIAVQRTLLHMVYHTTVSALHRPQFLPSSPAQAPTVSRQVQDTSRHRVKDAATHITAMAMELHHLRLERYLPTTGVTVMLPAMIIHLLEMKSPTAEARVKATRGFRQCMRVMGKLREIYSAADYATGFLDAALRKAAIDVHANVEPSTLAMMKDVPVDVSAHTPPPDKEVPSSMTPLEMFLPRPGEPTTALEPLMRAHSPPHTDLGSADLTPSAFNDAEALRTDMLDVDMMGDVKLDWNALSGTELDIDQWLQFPPEGLNGTEEDMMLNRYPDDAGDALGWVLHTDDDVQW